MTKPTYQIHLAEEDIDTVLDVLIEECMKTTCPIRAGYLHDLAHKFLRFIPPETFVTHPIDVS